jgi:serine/threonine-protein kinase RsbW
MNGSKHHTVSLTFSSSFDFMDTVHRVSDVILQAAGFGEDDRYWLTIAVREAITNAVKHGNKQNPHKNVFVTFLLNEERFMVRVQDEGEGFDISKVQDPRLPENLLKDKGRGIYYIKAFMDDVQFESDSGRGTTVTMVKRLEHNAKP